eukprot:COSAG01_NODE_9936_length_2298_cov_1.992724_3_plen_52_part_00
MIDEAQPCLVPKIVQQLPLRFRKTEAIEDITRVVLSTEAKSRVGFWGKGGM